MLQCSDSLWRTFSTFVSHIPEYGVGQVVLCDLHDVLEVELGVGVVDARVLWQEGEAEHSDRLHAGFLAALSQPRNVVERINGLKGKSIEQWHSWKLHCIACNLHTTYWTPVMKARQHQSHARDLVFWIPSLEFSKLYAGCMQITSKEFTESD